MAATIVNWSSLVSGAAYSLSLFDAVDNPNGQILRFDSASLSAYDLYVEAENEALTVISVTDLTTYKQVTLYLDALTVTTDNITFADGSRLLVGDNSYDTVYDNSGNWLTGGSGHDQLFGAGGDDTLQGGDGWDAFFDAYGDNTLIGGAGNDWFDVYSNVGSSNRVSGGSGSDLYYLDDYSPALLESPALAGHNYVVTDFTTGTGGDAIFVSDLSDIAIGLTDQDPFEAGYLRLVQSGGDTLFQGDRDGAAGNSYGWMTLITLENVQASSLTSANFPGLGTDLDDLLTGTEREDLLTGQTGNDSLAGRGGNDYLSGGVDNDTLDGGTGSDVMYGGSGADTYLVDDSGDVVYEADNTPSGSQGLRLGIDLGSTIDTVKASISHVLAAYVENLELVAGAGNLAATGNSLANVLVGNEGDNTLTGDAGNDTLDGGSGTDTAVFSGNLAAYSRTLAGSTWTVQANSGSDGTDTLTNVERLQFANAKIALDITGNKNACFDTSGLANAGQVYRLYEAMFNRAPDKTGLAYWIGQADVGTPLTTIATTFASGQEYRNKYGNLADHAFVDQLYLNVLGRAGEGGGLAYWYGQLDTRAMTREQVLVGFSESTENQAAVIGVIQNGIDFTV